MDSSSKTLPKAECLIISAMFGGSMALCIQASSAWGWIGGIGAWCAGEALRKSKSLTYDQVVKGSFDWGQDAIGEMGAIASPATRYVETQKNQIVISALKQLPMGDRLAESFIAAQGLTTDWFQGFEKRSAVICGESRDGKSFLLNWRVQRFLETHPDGEVLIGDIDYGSSHEGTEPNTWGGLPVGNVVLIEPAEITNAIFYVSDTVDQRAKSTAQAVKTGAPRPKYKPILLAIDEWCSYWDTLDEDQQEHIIKALRNICDRGIKQGEVVFVLGLHDLSVGMTGLPRALLRKMEVVLLFRASQSPRNYDNIDPQPRQVQEVINRIGALPKTIRGLRPCITYSDKQLTVKAIPQLELNPVEYVATGEPIDPDEQWVDEIWTPELEGKIALRMAERVSQGQRPVVPTEFWAMAGQQQRDQRTTNPRYMIFRRRCEALATKLQPEKSDPQDQGGTQCSDLDPSLEVSEA
ncbi:hypothetical protein NDI52_24715 [Leptolyngbya sp. PL-A3]|uniref:hypothetical protein n=1 Tax=Leptolyngbya sp. PL-A3 TaxID=2933911 RepID=UPI003297060C